MAGTPTPRLGLHGPTGPDSARIPYDLDILRGQLDEAAIYRVGTLGARPAASSVPDGTIYRATDTGAIAVSNGSTWSTLFPAPNKVFRVGHTLSVPGSLTASMVIPGFFVPVGAGQAVSVVGVRAKIGSGTSLAVQLQKNGSSVGSAVSVTTTAATTALSSSLADGDLLSVTTASPSGSPQNLSYTVILEHTT